MNLELILAIADNLATEIPIARDGGETRLHNPQDRLSMGITKRDGKFYVALMVEKNDGAAKNEATTIASKHTDVIVTTVGQAHSSLPDSSGPGSFKLKAGDYLLPGHSVGHYRGLAGSLGAFVLFDAKWLGFISASHVLSVNNKGKKGDAILLPGVPDGPRTLNNTIGTLQNYTYLLHHSRDDLDDPLNSKDVAVVKIDADEDTLELPLVANLLPNPKDTDRKIKLNGALSTEELLERLGEPVFKIGRSGFSSGTLEIARVKPQPIRLPNRLVYFFESILAVKSNGKDSFSKPGDSGSLVYTQDGKGVGLIIGGSFEYTFVSPLTLCLTDMNAQLYL